MNIKRTVCGVGYVGVGRHITSVKGVRTHTYMAWYNMMTRCYSKKLHERLPQYEFCEVSEEWQNFQNFAEWYESHEFSGLGYHVDKDLLKDGNTVYSAENCCLLPQEINKLITAGRIRSNSLQGTSWREESKVWRSSITKSGKVVYLGSFDTEIEAHLAYVKAKEDLVRNEAGSWLGKIEQRAYEALVNWSCKPSLR